MLILSHLARFLAIIGGEMDGEVLNSMKTLDLETDEWRMQSQTLAVARKDHACVLTRLDDEEGILVTGGVDLNNNALASVEFFSIPKQVRDHSKYAVRSVQWSQCEL